MYGLIAEEVAEVYPDLVVYDRDGQPETGAPSPGERLALKRSGAEQGRWSCALDGR